MIVKPQKGTVAQTKTVAVKPQQKTDPRIGQAKAGKTAKSSGKTVQPRTMFTALQLQILRNAEMDIKRARRLVA